MASDNTTSMHTSGYSHQPDVSVIRSTGGPGEPRPPPVLIQNPSITYVLTKFDDSSFSRSRDMIVISKILNGSRDRDHVSFRV